MILEFDHQPIASASLAQVHRARLRDGRLVAVKIQYPAIWEIVQTDLRRAGMLHVRKNGGRHHYSVNLDAPFRQPVIDGITLRQVLGRLTRQARPDGASRPLLQPLTG